MRIRKIKYNDHSVRGNLELDLVNSSKGTVYDNIVFAGENGTGKTTILTTLNEFLCGGSISLFAFIEYDVNDTELRAIPCQNSSQLEHGFWMMTDTENNLIQEMTIGRSRVDETLDNDERNIRINGSIFSKARADCQTTPITSITVLQIDASKTDNDHEENFTSLKQLIVDLRNQDDEQYRKMNESGSTVTNSTFEPQSKLFRFTSAFQNFFGGKIKFKEIIDIKNNNRNGQVEKHVIFKKNDKDISGHL
ncbi:hypothetical protein FACS1894187_14810 [Synergistales bacterium]|nr:hypothetical protein FACS1894187_14810 [Synergistales bacterium]